MANDTASRVPSPACSTCACKPEKSNVIGASAYLTGASATLPEKSRSYATRKFAVAGADPPAAANQAAASGVCVICSRPAAITGATSPDASREAGNGPCSMLLVNANAFSAGLRPDGTVTFAPNRASEENTPRSNDSSSSVTGTPTFAPRRCACAFNACTSCASQASISLPVNHAVPTHAAATTATNAPPATIRLFMLPLSVCETPGLPRSVASKKNGLSKDSPCQARRDDCGAPFVSRQLSACRPSRRPSPSSGTAAAASSCR